MSFLSAEQNEAVSDLVRRTGADCILPYFGKLAAGDISYKTSPHDPVTIADQKAEAMLESGLTAILPGSLFVGEEGVAADPGKLELLGLKDRPVWVSDPLDGTNSFKNGKDGFGPMVCLCLNGEKLASWTYEVTTQRLIVACRGDGVTVNGETYRNKPSDCGPLKGFLVWPVYHSEFMQDFKASASGYRLGPSVHPSIEAYWRLMEGQFDFLIYRKTSPWDHLPGTLAIEELGGRASRWDGGDYLVGDMDKGLIVARSPDILQQVRTDLGPGLTMRTP